MAQVLLVDSDESESRYTAVVLRYHGYDVRISKTGVSARQAVAGSAVDVVLIECGLPDMDGIDLCGELRAVTDAAIIFLSSRGDDVAKVLGLDAGADDYVTKPFSVGELTARIRAVLRRQQPPSRPATTLETGGVTLDLDRHRVIARGREIAVTRMEFKLLSVLIADAGTVVTRDRILEAVWGPNYFGDPNVLDVHVYGLRRKLKGITTPPDVLQTVRGVGYRFGESPAA